MIYCRPTPFLSSTKSTLTRGWVVQSVVLALVLLGSLGLTGCYIHPDTSLLSAFGEGGRAARFRPQADREGRRESLQARLANLFHQNKLIGDAERLVLAERLRGEEGRVRLVMDVLLSLPPPYVPLRRNEFLSKLADLPRPQRPPLIDQELGLEPHPPRLSSTAAPQALSRIASGLAGEGLLPDLLQQAERYLRAGEFIESAGVLSLAQKILEAEGTTEPMRSQVRKAWVDLANKRRCVALVYDAAQPKQHLLALSEFEQKPQPTEDLVGQLLSKDPSRLPCAVQALQLASSQPASGVRGTWGTRALLAPILISSQYASLSFLSPKRADLPPVVREAVSVRAALSLAIAKHLDARPGESWRLLPMMGQDPGGILSRERLDDLILSLIFAAPPVPDAAERLRWAYRRRYSVVAGQPLRYVKYLGALGPGWADGLVGALREPDPEVQAYIITTLSSFPIDVVERALASPGEDPASIRVGAAQERFLRDSLRALFRLPLKGRTAKDREKARGMALDLHRCCRGDRGSCDRLEMPPLNRCPVWTPLSWW